MKDGAFKDLQKPFNPSQIEWVPRIVSPRDYNKGGATKDNPINVKILPFPFIDARILMDRLDQIIGPENWQSDFKMSEHYVICGIGIKNNGEWIWKWDGGGSTDGDSDYKGKMSKANIAKGDFTVSFRRCAQVQWGMGRYLYRLESVWVKGTYDGYNLKFDPPKIPFDYLPLDSKVLHRAFNEIKVPDGLPLEKKSLKEAFDDEKIGHSLLKYLAGIETNKLGEMFDGDEKVKMAAKYIVQHCMNT